MNVKSKKGTKGTKAPKVAGIAPGAFDVAAEQLGEVWLMEQAWKPKPDRGFLAGRVRFGWEPKAFWVLADLPDREIFSKSTADDQNLWQLGDVFEIFIQKAGTTRYLELHVSPNGHQLHLRWSGASFRRVQAHAADLDGFRAPHEAFESWVKVSVKQGGWQVLARIPSSIFPGREDFCRGQRFSASFSRYDADRTGANPVLSSTSPHAVASYHRREEWRMIHLG